MKPSITIPVLCALTIASVSVSATEAVQQVDPAAANLVIYRPMESKSSIYYRISVDGKHVGKLKRGRSINLKLPAGDHVISANDKNRTTHMVSVPAQGPTTFVKNEVDRKQNLSFEIQNNKGSADYTASLE